MNSNTPQGTGAMTLDQGVAHIKAKMAERGATADDQVIAHPEHPDDEEDRGPGDRYGGVVNPDDSALDETADSVSTDESPDPSQTPGPDNRPVTLPDGSQITVEEARKGYLRQADFTRKTTELARERERVVAQEQAMLAQMAGLHQLIASFQEPEPNWQELARSRTPDEFQLIQNQWRQRAAQANAARQVLAQAESNAMKAQRAQLWASLGSGSFDPTWRDPDVLSGALNTLAAYLVDRGVPAELVSTIQLPAVIEIAEESRRYRALQKAKPRAALAVTGKPQPVRPGSKTTASPNAENIRLLHEAFVKNPSIDNAAALESARAASRRR